MQCSISYAAETALWRISRALRPASESICYKGIYFHTLSWRADTPHNSIRPTPMQCFFHQGVCSAAPGKVVTLLPHFIGKMNQTRTEATCLVTQQVWEQKPSCFLAYHFMDWTKVADSIYLLDKPKPQGFCVKKDYWASQPTLLHRALVALSMPF